MKQSEIITINASPGSGLESTDRRRGPGAAKRPADIAEVSDSDTRLTLTGSMGGVVGALMGAFSKSRMRRDLRDEPAPIKEAAEALG